MKYNCKECSDTGLILREQFITGLCYSCNKYLENDCSPLRQRLFKSAKANIE